MTTIEERVSRLEGGYEHLATKADLANLRAELNDKFNDLRGHQTRLVLALAGLQVAGLAAAAAIVNQIR